MLRLLIRPGYFIISHQKPPKYHLVVSSIINLFSFMSIALLTRKIVIINCINFINIECVNNSIRSMLYIIHIKMQHNNS